MTVYRTLYIDREDNTFAGEEWIAETQEEYNKALALEAKVFDELDIIELISIVKPVETIVRTPKENV